MNFGCFLLFITHLIIITLILKGIVMFLSLTGILMTLYVCLLEKNNLQRDLFRTNTKEKSENEVLIAQSCVTLCNPMDYSLPGSLFHQILQARTLAIPFSRGSSWPGDLTWFSCITGRIPWTEESGRLPSMASLSLFSFVLILNK